MQQNQQIKPIKQISPEEEFYLIICKNLNLIYLKCCKKNRGWKEWKQD